MSPPSPLEPARSINLPLGFTQQIIRQGFQNGNGELERPMIPIRYGSFAPPAAGLWHGPLTQRLDDLVSRLAAVGQVRLLTRQPSPAIGTAWVVADGVVVTNKHVLTDHDVVREEGGQTHWVPPDGSLVVDFLQEDGRPDTDQHTIRGLVGGLDDLDLALLWIDAGGAARSPLNLEPHSVAADHLVAAVGYPSRTGSSETTLERLFGPFSSGLKKTLSPGRIDKTVQDEPRQPRFHHDCSLTPGSSGSPLISLDTGNVVAIHSTVVPIENPANRFLPPAKMNLAIPSQLIRKFVDERLV